MDGVHSESPFGRVQRQQVSGGASCPELRVLTTVATFHPNRIRNKNHMYDATEIFRSLSGHKKESFIKLGFYLLSFFYYLYRYVHPNGVLGRRVWTDAQHLIRRMIVALISESE
jgi:hypothetical protein